MSALIFASGAWGLYFLLISWNLELLRFGSYRDLVKEVFIILDLVYFSPQKISCFVFDMVRWTDNRWGKGFDNDNEMRSTTMPYVFSENAT